MTQRTHGPFEFVWDLVPGVLDLMLTLTFILSHQGRGNWFSLPWRERVRVRGKSRYALVRIDG